MQLSDNRLGPGRDAAGREQHPRRPSGAELAVPLRIESRRGLIEILKRIAGRAGASTMAEPAEPFSGSAASNGYERGAYA